VAQAAAFFDVDGTLVSTHIVHQYIYIRRQMIPGVLRPLWTGAFYALKGPYYKVMDRISRTKLNIVFYRSYAGLPTGEVRALVESCFENVLRPHLFHEGSECITAHRAAGRRIVFVTGSIDFIIAPLARHLGADAVIAPQLLERDGRFTGELDGLPVGQEEKARRIREYAEREDIDLSESFAYGDSIADVPMLRSVGNPGVVNPDRPLATAAREMGWPVYRWMSRNGSTPSR
jgi:HAD superfamily hydrolase (TIGR01490 family)